MDEQEIIDELKTTEKQAVWLMENWPICRDNDFYLVLQYMRRILKVDIWFDWETIQHMGKGKMEGLCRVRRKIQNEKYDQYPHLLPRDPEVIKRRRVKEEIIRKYISNI